MHLTEVAFKGQTVNYFKKTFYKRNLIPVIWACYNCTREQNEKHQTVWIAIRSLQCLYLTTRVKMLTSGQEPGWNSICSSPARAPKFSGKVYRCNTPLKYLSTFLLINYQFRQLALYKYFAVCFYSLLNPILGDPGAVSRFQALPP